MRRFYLIASSVALFLVGAVAARAGIEQVQFPISELGNCASRAACAAYCDTSNHIDACLTFAEKNQIISSQEARAARRIVKQNGPGGCKSTVECSAYCNDTAHAEECVAFAEQHGLMKAKEAAFVRTVVREGGPGGCQTKAACEAFCQDPAHVDVCLNFSVSKGLMSKEDAQVARTVLTTGGPGGCFNPSSCRAYCDAPDHLEECVSFAEGHNFMTHADAESARRAAGQGPGGCRGEAACRAFCNDPAHTNVCVDFSVQNGFISKTEADRFKKLKDVVGPGSCRGETACRAYCEGPAHSDECFKFGVDQGLISPAQIEQAKKMLDTPGPGGCRGEACRSYCENQDHANECITFAANQGLMPVAAAQQARDNIQLLDAGGPGGCRGQACQTFCTQSQNTDVCLQFARAHNLISSADLKQAQVEKQQFDQKQQDILKTVTTSGGPGGCRGEAPCRAYCSDPSHESECYRFGVDHGFVAQSVQTTPATSIGGGNPLPSNFTGPGGCQSPGECAQYCSNPAHFDDCRRFRPAGATVAPAPISPTINPNTTPAPPLPFVVPPEVSPFTNAQFQGPGGCKSPAECFAYCTNHPRDCGMYAPPPQMPTATQSTINAHVTTCPAVGFAGCPYGNVVDPQTGCPTGQCIPPPNNITTFVGPGGCRGADECRVYCSLHPTECARPPDISQCPAVYPPSCGAGTILFTQYTPQGCPTYVCRAENRTQCPPVTNSCPYGYENDPQTGCGTNVCRPSPVQCPPAVGVMCREGFNAITTPGPNGCPITECRSSEVRIHPCPLMPVRECTLTEERVTSTNPDGCVISYCRVKDRPTPCRMITIVNCPAGQEFVYDVDQNGCTAGGCHPRSTDRCPQQTFGACPSDTESVIHPDANGCTIQDCRPRQTPRCLPGPWPTSCSSDSDLYTQTDTNGCSVTVCRLKHVVCPVEQAPRCPGGMTPNTITDLATNCTYYRCPEVVPPPVTCPSPPSCTYETTRPAGSTCPVYTCRTVPPPPAPCPVMTMPVCPSATPYFVPIMDADNRCPLSMTCSATPPAGMNCAPPPSCPQSGGAYDTTRPAGSSCPVYTCRSTDRSNCPSAPPCAAPNIIDMTPGLGSSACATFTCRAPGSVGTTPTPFNCPTITPPACAGGAAPVTTTDAITHCPTYRCPVEPPSTCPSPPSCPQSNGAYDTSRPAGSTCAVYTCRTTTSSQCPPITMPSCTGATPYMNPTMDAANRCPTSMTCSATAPTSSMPGTVGSSSCPPIPTITCAGGTATPNYDPLSHCLASYTCPATSPSGGTSSGGTSSSGSCPTITMPTCTGSTPYMNPTMDAANRCPTSMTCSATPPAGMGSGSGSGSGSSSSCPPPTPITCPAGQTAMPTMNGSGCVASYYCATTGSGSGSGTSSNCPAPPVCPPPSYTENTVVPNGCTTYRCVTSSTSGTQSCPTVVAPSCGSGLTSTYSTDSRGCGVYTCTGTPATGTSSGAGTSGGSSTTTCPPAVMPTCGAGMTARYMTDPHGTCGGYACMPSTSGAQSYHPSSCNSQLGCVALCVLTADVDACASGFSSHFNQFARY